jgi:nucleoid DNA-binding protein
LTSIVTLIHDGNPVEAQVHYFDGRIESVGLDALAAYITEKQNPENVKGVKHLTIQYPSEFLQGGVVLVDTPGLGSVYAHNTDVTYGFIPQVDAAIFLLSTDPPMTKMEYDFLRQIKPTIPRFLFVLNKIDHMDEKEWTESLDFSRDMIIHELKDETITVYPVSARMGLEGKIRSDHALLDASRFPMFEQALMDYLQNDTRATLIQSAMIKGERYLTTVRSLLNIQRQLVEGASEEIQGKFQRFIQMEKDISRQRADMQILLKETIQSMAMGVHDEIRKSITAVMPALSKELDDYVDQMEQRPFRQSQQAIQAWIEARGRVWFDDLREKLERDLRIRLDQEEVHLTRQTQQILDQIVAESAGIFNVTLPAADLSMVIALDDDFYYRFGDLSTPHLMVDVSQLGVALLPWKIRNQYIKRIYRDKLAQQMDRNVGRTREDFANRVQKGLQITRDRLDGIIAETLTTIKNVIDRAMEIRQEGQSAFSVAEQKWRRIETLLTNADHLLHHHQTEETGSFDSGINIV